MQAFSILEHTSDVGIAARGKTLADLFAQVANALCAILYEGPLAPDLERAVWVSGNSREELLVNWLQEILFHLETGPFLTREVHIDQLSDTHLRATLAGVSLAGSGIRLDHEVKAATYHQLSITETRGTWKATVYLDL